MAFLFVSIIAVAHVASLLRVVRLGRTPGWYLLLFGSAGLWLPVISSLSYREVGIKLLPSHLNGWDIHSTVFLLGALVVAAGFVQICLEQRRLHDRAADLKRRIAAIHMVFSSHTRTGSGNSSSHVH